MVHETRCWQAFQQSGKTTKEEALQAVCAHAVVVPHPCIKRRFDVGDTSVLAWNVSEVRQMELSTFMCQEDMQEDEIKVVSLSVVQALDNMHGFGYSALRHEALVQIGR